MISAIPSTKCLLSYLEAVALDASHEAVKGVTLSAEQATKADAARKEITETIRVAHYTSG
jgi:alkylhydroperoxidase/carboxymuconolactone decarboxylase family protein YurZ